MRLTVSYGCLHADASTRCVQLQQDAVLRPYNLQLPNTVSELRGQSPPAPTAVPLRQLLRVPLSLPPLFLRGERHRFRSCIVAEGIGRAGELPGGENAPHQGAREDGAAEALRRDKVLQTRT